MDLANLRGQLDQIDCELATLLKKRMELSRQVAEYKIESGKGVYDKKREDQKLEAIDSGDADGEKLRELFEAIMSVSRNLQYQIIENNAWKEKPDSLPKENGKRFVVSFDVEDESGSLYRALSHFKYNHLNIRRIESGPSEEKDSIHIILETDSNFAEDALRCALRGLKEETMHMQIQES